MRVLVVEDNALLRHHLKVQIQDAGHQVDDAEDAKEADYYLNEHIPDIAIVDLGLPDEDGLSLIRRWRSNDVSLPILVLTARESWQDKVEVLSAGADDYVTKPFHIEEVMARMQALMRRNSGLASQVISLPPFQVDLSRRELSINDEVIKLTAFEYTIMETLIRNNGKVVSKDSLLNKQPSSLSPLVQLAGIRKCFDGKEVIPQLDLTINNGEFLTLLGPSGCGKTTVLRLIAGLETVDSGRIMLDNEDITHVPAENRYVNTVFQSYALFPHMTVFENVAFGLRMQKTPAAEITPRVMEALRMVQLETFAQRKPHQLSGGQQQRVAIARAVVNKPRLLLLDESLSALDYKLRKQMQNELKALQRKLGITFVFVTHDQEEALTMSDRIVVMRDGRIEQDGTPREIYEEPKNLFVAGFIGEINMFNATVIERLDEQRVRANVEGRECNIYVNFAVEPGQKLHVLLRPEDLRVEEINDDNHAEGLIGYVRERNYKGMTLESVVELENGKMVMVSEFFNEDDPDFDHSLDQKMAINWVESWEVVLADEEHK